MKTIAILLVIYAGEIFPLVVPAEQCSGLAKGMTNYAAGVVADCVEADQ